MFRITRVAAVGVVGIGVSLAAFSAFASQADGRSAFVDVLARRVTVAQGGSPVEIFGERVVRRGDRIRTDASGRALITYRDGSTVLLDPDSELVIELIEVDERGVLVRMTQTLGRVWYSLSRSLSVDSRFEVHSPAMASVIRAGSDSYVVVGPNGETTVVVTEGTVDTAGAGVTVTVAAGSATSVDVGSPPSSPASAPSSAPRPTAAPTTRPNPSPTTTATSTPTASRPPSPAPRPARWPSPPPTAGPIPPTPISAPPLPSHSATVAPVPTLPPVSPALP